MPTRILSCFKLNPYEHLNVRFDATDEDINKKYRQISLQVHPDKCTHPRAKEAFEVLGDARKLLNDEDKRRDLSATLQFVKGEMLKEWRKEHRHDNAAKLLAQASGTVRQEDLTGVALSSLRRGRQGLVPPPTRLCVLIKFKGFLISNRRSMSSSGCAARRARIHPPRSCWRLPL